LAADGSYDREWPERRPARDREDFYNRKFFSGGTDGRFHPTIKEINEQ
jgi:hypothetical protein